jgi:hypothetical protein
MNDIDEAEMDPETDQDEVEPDKNSLGYILGQALNEIRDVGGNERHRLTQVISRPVYDRLLERPAASRALDAWLDAAGPKSKKAAGRVLAIQVAKVARSPELVGRIERELADAFDYGIDTGRSGETPSKASTTAQVQKHRAAVDQRRNGQRVSYQSPKGTDLHMLAEMADSRKYIEARRRQLKGR